VKPPGDPIEFDLARNRIFLLRALRLRCPQCGTGRMFRRWLYQLPRCSACGLDFDRGESDYFIGAYIVNLIVAELLVVVGMLVGMWLTWPDVPWNQLKWVLLPFVIVAPIVSFPFSKSFWLAIDLIHRPPTPDDYEIRKPL
jgi:uncharacterized protein (DUF983 family)